jgi:hypothetical protein
MTRRTPPRSPVFLQDDLSLPRCARLTRHELADPDSSAPTHSSHPVQSSAYTCSVKRVSGSPRASSGAERKAEGAPASSDSS